MRRQKPSSYYHPRTKVIVDNTYENWQLTKTDEREGVHALLNRAVVAVSDLATESEYIEQKFFPDRMDIDEPWLLYKVEQAPGSLLFTSGDFASSVLATLPKASSLDEFFDGYFDACVPVSTSLLLSGETEGVSAIRSSLEHYETDFIVQRSNNYSTYSIEDAKELESDELVTVSSGTLEFYTDKCNRVIVLDITSIGDYKLVDASGNEVEHQLVTKANATGYYDSNLDIDNNGVICQYEYDQFMRYYGSKMSDYTPSDWDKVSWADINKNDKIDEIDLKSIKAVLPALRDDVACAICVTDAYVGKLKLIYKTELAPALYFYRTSTGYSYSTKSSAYYKYGYICGYDEELDTYYVLDAEKNVLRSVSSAGDITSLLYVPGWSPTAKIVDIDYTDPFLYALSYNGSTCRLYFSEMKSEAPTQILNHIEVPVKTEYGAPVKFTISADNMFKVLFENALVEYKMLRTTFYSTEEPAATFFHRKPHLFDTTGTLVEPERHYVFNSFDSFAYSLGIARPYGVDNEGMRKLIYDFFIYPQGLGKAEVSYGIMRELGYTNTTLNSGTQSFTLPGYLTSGSLCSVNEHPFTVTGEYPIVINNVCTIGVKDITFTRDFLLENSGSTITLDADFIDDYKNSNRLSISFDQPVYATKPLVEVHSFRDTEYLNHIGFIVSGEPSSAFATFVDDLETNAAFTYSTCIPDVSIFGSERIPSLPILPTIFDTMVYSSGNLEVVIE